MSALPQRRFPKLQRNERHPTTAFRLPRNSRRSQSDRELISFLCRSLGVLMDIAMGRWQMGISIAPSARATYRCSTCSTTTRCGIRIEAITTMVTYHACHLSLDRILHHLLSLLDIPVIQHTAPIMGRTPLPLCRANQVGAAAARLLEATTTILLQERIIVRIGGNEDRTVRVYTIWLIVVLINSR